MRFTLPDREIPPQMGSTRMVKKFLLWPRYNRHLNMVVWLETVEVVEFYMYSDAIKGYVWEEITWHPIDSDTKG